jgi:hypothetical protein
MLNAIDRALAVFHRKDVWTGLMKKSNVLRLLLGSLGERVCRVVHKNDKPEFSRCTQPDFAVGIE